MNSMPKIVRWIAFLLIGPPGGIVWLAGAGFLVVAVGSALGGHFEWPASPLMFLGGGLLATVGFAMMVCSEILLGTPRYRVPWPRFAPCIGFDALVVHLTFLSGGFVVAAFFMLIAGDWPRCVLSFAAGGILLWVRILTDRRWKDLRSKWQAEFHPHPPESHLSDSKTTQEF